MVYERVPDHPAYPIALVILAILSATASWAWLQFAKYPTQKYRVIAGRFTGWLFAFVAICAMLVLLSL